MSTTATSSAAAAVAASSTSVITPGKIGTIIGVLGIVATSVVLYLGNTSNLSDLSKENYNLGGSLGLIASVALILFSSGAFNAAKAAISSSDTSKSIFTIVIVLISSIGIFLTIFWNYSSSSDTISLSTTILVLFLLGGIVVAMFKYSGQVPIASFITTTLFVLYHFMPYVAFSFGIIVDMLTRRIEFVGSSFAGITAVLLNFAVGRAIYGSVKVSNPLCEIPGLSGLSSPMAPQPVVAVTSTLAYIATYLTASVANNKDSLFKSGAVATWPQWAILFGAAVIQGAGMVANDCFGSRTVDGGGFALFKQWLTGLILGTGFGSALGGTAYAVFADRYSSNTLSPGPSAPILGPGGTQTCPDGRPPDANGRCGQYSSSSVGTCSAGSSDGEFICESFENGKLKTKVITE